MKEYNQLFFCLILDSSAGWEWGEVGESKTTNPTLTPLVGPNILNAKDIHKDTNASSGVILL